MVALRVGSRARMVSADVGKTGGYSCWVMLLVREAWRVVGAFAGGEISARVGL